MRKFCMNLKHSAAFIAGLALLLVTGPLLADNIIPAPGLGGSSAWTVYAFSNAQAVADAFRALANFTSSATFQSIVGLIAVLGILTVGVSSGFSSMVAKRFIGYSVSVFLVTYIFFGVGNGGPLVVMVEVQDTVDGTWVAPVTVPAVVGIPASLISTAGMEITKQIEASFAIPDALKMGNGAPFNLAASMIADAGQARISDPNLASSLAYYVQDCFTVAVANGALSATTLVTSTDFLNDIHWNSVAVMVNTQLPSGVNALVSCEDAWQRINTAVNSSGSDGAAFLKNASAWARTPALSVVNAAADGVAAWATNNGITSGGAMIKQAAVLSSFNGAFRQAAAATGNSDFLTGMNITQARETQTTGWIIGAEVFNRSMGYVYAIIQVFVYAILPLVLAVALVPGLGFALLKNFGQILLWLAIWQPMLAIVNFIVLSMQQADLGGVLSSGVGTYGFTLSNMGVISEKTSSMRAAALFIGTMVPALAWSMVKGSVDFSKFIGEASGEKFAHTASNSMTTGNYSLNQGAMDSFTANKTSTSATSDHGGFARSAGGFGMNNTRDYGGAQEKVGGTSLGIQKTKDDAVSSGVQTQTTAADTKNAMNTISAADAAAWSKVNAIMTQTGNNFMSGEHSNANMGMSGHPGAALMPRPGQPGNAQNKMQAGMPGALGSDPGAPAPSAANTKKPPGMVKQVAGALAGAPSLGVQQITNRGHDQTHGTTANDGRNANQSRTGTQTGTTSDGQSLTNAATTNEGYQTSQRQTITGVASGADRADAIAANQYQSSLTYGAQPSGDWAKPGSEIGKAMNELGHSGADLGKAQIDSVAASQQDHEKKMKDIEDKVRQDEAAARAKAKATANEASGKVAAGESPAKQGAISRMVDVAQERVTEAADKAQSLAGEAGEFAREQVATAQEHLHDIKGYAVNEAKLFKKK